MVLLFQFTLQQFYIYSSSSVFPKMSSPADHQTFSSPRESSPSMVINSFISSTPGNPVQYMYRGTYNKQNMLSSWRSSVWEISGVQVSWDSWSSYVVAILLIFIESFHNSTTGVPDFFLIDWLYVSAFVWCMSETFSLLPQKTLAYCNALCILWFCFLCFEGLV